MNLGYKIKQKRKVLQLTQEELANRCELTKGYISLLENNKTSPSIETLTHILEVLGTTLSEFFHSDDDLEIVFDNDVQYEKDFDGYKQLWLVPTSQMLSMEPILLVVGPNKKTIQDNPHVGEEFGYVISGEITVFYGNTVRICKENECFYFPTNKAHYLFNHTEKETKILWVSCPPNF